MTEPSKPLPENATHARNGGLGWLLFLLAMVLPLAAIVTGMVLTYFEEGELILTARGCRVMAHHGVPVEALDEEGLCRIRARFHFVPDTTRFGTIRIDTPKGQLDIDMSASEVVSKATY